MKVLRTFHPIGQGAFYTERFYDDQNNRKYTIVFDCGYLWKVKAREKKLVKHTFDDKEIIDYLFISHLDRDHISLVDTLLSHVRLVRKIVLPLVSEEDLVITLTLLRITEDDSSARFVSRVLSHLRGERGDDYMGGDYTIQFVADLEHQQEWSDHIWNNGDKQSLGLFSEWVFIPYNSDYGSKKEDLKNKLKGLLEDSDVLQEIKSLKVSITNSNEFYDKLKDASFVGNVIKNNDVLLKKLRQVYDTIDGSINDNSLQLYSGPITTTDFHYSIASSSSCEWCPFHPCRVACLYTGDCKFDMDKWSKEFVDVWNHVGTIQLPHHGSDLSFDVSKDPLKKPHNRSYTFVASCGNCNSFGHPSDRVLEYLALSGCTFHIVTESVDSIYMQRIDEYTKD